MASRWPAPLLLAAAVIVAYLNSFAGTFQFDDFNVIVANPTVHSLDAWFADLGRGIRPLLKLSYTLNWILGPGETGFHGLNLAVHVANTLLVYHLATLLTGSRVAAFIAALLFGLHPAQTEAVTYISGRSISLMTMFYLGALAAYAAGSVRGDRLLLYAVSPALFVAALAAKEVAVTFPFALLWWEASRGDRAWEWKEIARRQAAHWAILLVAALALLAHPRYASWIVPELDAASLHRNALTQVDAISYLVLRLVVIHPLNIDPDLRMVSEWNYTLVAEAVFLAMLCIAGVLSLRRRPWWGLGLAWFFLQLLPTNSLLPRLDLANDRHLYLAIFGLCVAAGIEIARLRPRFVPAVSFVIMLLATCTVIRNRDYTSEVALWEQTATVSPGKPRVFNNLGHAYSRAGRMAEAQSAYREALRLHPGYDLARENLERASSIGR